MNPGPIEETGKVASTLITNLKDSPLTLALVLFNLVFVAVIYFSTLDLRDHQEKLTNRLIEQLDKNQTLISQCIQQKPGG